MKTTNSFVKSGVISLFFFYTMNANAALKVQETDIQVNEQWQSVNQDLLQIESITNYHNESIDFEKGLKLANQALEIVTREVGEEHLATAYSYNNQAIMLIANEKYDEALNAANKSLSILDGLFNNRRNYRHADVLNTLGNVYIQKEKLENAEKYLFEAKSVMDSEDNNLLDSYEYRVMLIEDSIVDLRYYNQESSETLILLYKDLIEKYGGLIDSDGVLYTLWTNNLAEEYREVEEYENAYRLHKQNLETRKKTLSQNHEDLATSYNNMSLLYFGSKISLIEATNFIDKSLDIARNRQTYDTEDGFNKRLNRAFIVTNESDSNTAKKVFNKLLVEVETIQNKNPSVDWVQEYKSYILEHLKTLEE